MAITIRCFIPPENWWGKSCFRSGGRPTIFRISSTRASTPALSLYFLWSWRTSAIWSPTVRTGFRLVIGSWNIMETVSPRSRRISASEAAVTSVPANRIDPLAIRPTFSGSSFKMLRAVVVFPAPVSPTRPRVSPLSRNRSIPFTA